MKKLYTTIAYSLMYLLCIAGNRPSLYAQTGFSIGAEVQPSMVSVRDDGALLERLYESVYAPSAQAGLTFSYHFSDYLAIQTGAILDPYNQKLKRYHNTSLYLMVPFRFMINSDPYSSVFFSAYLSYNSHILLNAKQYVYEPSYNWETRWLYNGYVPGGTVAAGAKFRLGDAAVLGAQVPFSITGGQIYNRFSPAMRMGLDLSLEVQLSY